MSQTVEIVFDDNSGKFVIHYSGVATHAEEHQITDEILARLEKIGFKAEVSHYHDQPKVPDIQEEEDSVRSPEKTKQRSG